MTVLGYFNSLRELGGARRILEEEVRNTLKGYGVSFMAGNYKWHMGVPTDEEFATAMRELGETDGGEA